jgi:hypothetical protein
MAGRVIGRRGTVFADEGVGVFEKQRDGILADKDLQQLATGADFCQLRNSKLISSHHWTSQSMAPF